MKSNLKSVLLAVIVLSCFALQASGDWLGGGDLAISDVEHTAEYLAKTGGTPNPPPNSSIKEDVQESMKGEDIFYISPETGMSPDVPAGSVTELADAPADVAGNWSFELTDNLKGDLNLTLFQIGRVVFGYGQIAINDSDLVATASGIIDGNELDLDVVTLEDVTLYKLNLNVATRSISGSYVVYSTEGGSWPGVAIGRPQV
jgi:hypothetical protein